MNYIEEFNCLMGLTTEQLIRKFGAPLYYYPNLYIYRTKNTMLFVKLKPFVMYGEEYNVPTEVVAGYAIFSCEHNLLAANNFRLLSEEACILIKNLMEQNVENVESINFFEEYPCLTYTEGNFCCLIYVTDKGIVLCVDSKHKVIKGKDFFNYEK